MFISISEKSLPIVESNYFPLAAALQKSQAQLLVCSFLNPMKYHNAPDLSYLKININEV